MNFGPTICCRNQNEVTIRKFLQKGFIVGSNYCCSEFHCRFLSYNSLQSFPLWKYYANKCPCEQKTTIKCPSEQKSSEQKTAHRLFEGLENMLKVII